ncbi:hypothetical protein L4C36_23530, partial [Photobacterium japonica]
IYYTPIYLFGIIVSQQRDFLLNKLYGKELTLLSVVIFFALLEVSIGSGNQKTLLSYEGFDVSFFQKVFLCLLFFVYFTRFEGKSIPILTMVSNFSFGIFFLHPWLISIFDKVEIQTNTFFTYLSSIGLNLSLCILMIMTLKKVFSSFSKNKFNTRYILGC